MSEQNPIVGMLGMIIGVIAVVSMVAVIGPAFAGLATTVGGNSSAVSEWTAAFNPLSLWKTVGPLIQLVIVVAILMPLVYMVMRHIG